MDYKQALLDLGVHPAAIDRHDSRKDLDGWYEDLRHTLESQGRLDAPRRVSKISAPIDGPYEVVGTVTLNETTDLTTYYEYAAYWDTIRCEPQTVPLLSNGYYCTYTFEGVLVGGGRNLSDRYGKERIGKPERYTGRPYAHVVEDALDDEADRVITYRLNDEEQAERDAAFHEGCGECVANVLT